MSLNMKRSKCMYWFSEVDKRLMSMNQPSFVLASVMH